ncbi:hypothetical protein GLAREA_07950 [Glarea lozoyensis ATCC 20868]|uniref:Uncharacterized protein n=1 Tax=Glarea lozoyensis (strain ATCC 20868 / MF5171) TaxID=1116229 RepID=S3CDK4_GLAL2|nr:uncharacterized protein GLAREA_07950 [Glarea lozoyensis ATCC 20868]EPE24100.1 hypothetical protein GLAREA_07950 [Glarea lozoyensis ATCC 20868]
MNTPGMKNVEAAFNKGGGAGTSKPGHASLKDDPERNNVMLPIQFNLRYHLITICGQPEGSKLNGVAGIGTQSHEENYANQMKEVKSSVAPIIPV